MASKAAQNNSALRLYLLAAVLVFWCGAICARLVYLQIFSYGTFALRAQHQQQRTMDVAAKRGVIYDRAGRELAMSVTVDSAFAVPAEVPDLAGTLSLISNITKTDPREMLAKCQSAKTFCWIARKTDAETAQRIRALNLHGIYFQKESKRFYPKRELASQILGYVGLDDEGLSGIEREFNDELKGQPGRMLISVDARKKWYASVEKQPEAGHNVVLTIDEQIQYIAEKELQTAMEQTQAIAGTVVVENPHTGEILALANSPTFNPNSTREIRPETLKDRAVSDVYEPGSTFKVVTLSAALDQHLTTPNEVFDCQMGSIVVNGRRIHDWKAFGNLSVADILAHSSDVGAIKVALRLGNERLYNYIRAYGFGQYTGIELPGETHGLAKPLNRWSAVSIGAISMGQEIGVSPLQLAGMISTIANDGVLVPPRVVAGKIQPTGSPQTVAFHPAEGHRVISPMTAAEMKQMMQGVVLHGTGKKAILEGYSSAGKTGTAQKIDPATRTYSKTKYIASFAGFAPVNSPAVTIAVIIDSPVGGHHGGEVGAPIFNRIAQQVLEYLHTQHDVELPASRQLLLTAKRATDQDLGEGSPDHPGEALETADAGADPSKPSAAASTPQGAVVPVSAPISHEPVRTTSTVPPPGSENSPMPRSGTVILEADQYGIVVPSFAGRTVRTAIEIAEDNGLELEVLGSGVARQQDPPAGSHVASGSHITVRFER